MHYYCESRRNLKVLLNLIHSSYSVIEKLLAGMLSIGTKDSLAIPLQQSNNCHGFLSVNVNKHPLFLYPDICMWCVNC